MHFRPMNSTDNNVQSQVNASMVLTLKDAQRQRSMSSFTCVGLEVNRQQAGCRGCWKQGRGCRWPPGPLSIAALTPVRS